MNAMELSRNLGHFYGTEQWHRNPLYPKMLYTDGVEFFAENAGGGAYWFLDIVGTEVFDLHRKGEEFIVVKLTVYPEARDGVEAVITADDGNDNILWTREIHMTDCPVGEWKFYLENNVLCLPAER